MTFSKLIEVLDRFFRESNICPSHGYDHALRVYTNMSAACMISPLQNQSLKDIILMAALLHDVDDRKFFTSDDTYANAKKIMQQCGYDEQFIADTCKCISFVSSAKNHDSIPEEITDADMEMLLPRYADRVEAIGHIGMFRLLQYSKSQNRPLRTPETPLITSIDELNRVATKQRYNEYSGKSASAMDHMLDKLIRLGDSIVDCGNEYLAMLAQHRSQITKKYYIDISQWLLNGADDSRVIEDVMMYALIHSSIADTIQF